MSAARTSGCYPLGCSAFFTFLGGAMLVIGASIPQRRYTDNSSFNFRHYDLYFYTIKSSALGGATITGPIPDCIKSAYSAGMALGIIGGAFALLGGVTLTYCAKKWQSSPLRFMRPVVLLFASVCGAIATVISGATTECDGSDFSEVYKLFVGFAFLLVGSVFLFLAAVANCAQAVSCPDPTNVSSQPALVQTHPQGQFVHQMPLQQQLNQHQYPAQPQQQYGSGFAHNGGVAPAPYNYNTAQQQAYQNNNNNAYPYNGGQQQQHGGGGNLYGQPVMGIPADSVGGGIYGNGGGGTPVFAQTNTTYNQQPRQRPTFGGPGVY